MHSCDHFHHERVVVFQRGQRGLLNTTGETAREWHLFLNLGELFLQVYEFLIPRSGTAMPLSRWCLTGRDITGKAKKQHSALGVWFTKYMLCENA